MYSFREYVDASNLCLIRRQSLKGAKPADLPAEQPTKFELVVNLKAVKEIGATIPQGVLLKADRVIK